MRHIRYYNNQPKQKLNKQIEEQKNHEHQTSFWNSMSNTTKYILIGLGALVILLIIYLFFFRGSNSGSQTSQQSNTKSSNIGIDTDSNSTVSIQEVISNEIDNEDATSIGTIDDIIIDSPQTGKPVTTMRYVYF